MKKLLVVGAVLALVVAACGDGTASTTTTATTPTTQPSTSNSTSTLSTSVPSTTVAPSTTVPAEMAAVAYFLLTELEEGAGPYLVPVHRTVPHSAGVVAAAVEQLLAGPTEDETAGMPSISSAVPEGTQLLGVDLDDGVATVDLTGDFEEGGGTASMQARLAQLAYTVTRMPHVDSVVLQLDGVPVDVFSGEGLVLDGPQTRDDYVDMLPPIFVDSPAWGEPVESPFVVSGVASVFEATLQLLVTDDDGAPLFEETVTASCGTGCWGDFSVEVPYEIDRQQFGAVIVWDFSPQDGSRENIREYPIQLR